MTSGGQQQPGGQRPGKQRQDKDTRTERGQQRIQQQRQERERRKKQQNQAQRKGERGKPAFVPETSDDVLAAVAIAALVAGMGLSSLAIWAAGGWGGLIGYLVVVGVFGVVMIVQALDTKKRQHTTLVWFTVIGVAFAFFSALWLLL